MNKPLVTAVLIAFLLVAIMLLTLGTVVNKVIMWGFSILGLIESATIFYQWLSEDREVEERYIEKPKMVYAEPISDYELWEDKVDEILSR